MASLKESMYIPSPLYKICGGRVRRLAAPSRRRWGHLQTEKFFELTKINVAQPGNMCIIGTRSDNGSEGT